jgi:DNA-3-methyladenine glycosylase II
LYGLDPIPTAKQLEPLGDPFRPYRSLVAWWCWRAADTVTPE